MKQTILSKCFSKMKRVALTLFAALCVGSVWAEEGEVTTPDVTPEPTPFTSALNIDERYGYVRTGLGEFGDQAIVVFTNSSKDVTCTWTPPKGLKNIEFLAVGGGGGGGGHFFRTDSGTNKKYNQGGAGGGGGAVVVGFIKDLAATDIVSVTVGAGGNGGSATSYNVTNAAGAGKADPGSNSVIRVNGTTYITAYGGAGDGGKDSSGVANGGSNSGVRTAGSAIALKSVTVIGAGVEGLVSDVVAYANKGGPGKSTDSGYAAAGGGGAHPTEGEGHQSSGSSYGGHGGYGYESYITDSLVYYGAGGGGGTGKSSGTGTVDWGANVAAKVHGAGRSPADADGTSGLPNQGGGGGGGSYKKNGGAGGSGVVILRFAYSETDIPVDATVDILPKISDKVYTGEVLSSGLVETFAYKVEELEECVNVGDKVVRVTLNEGYAWADGSTERYKDFPWNILKQDNNVWVTTPFINVDSWGQTYTSSVIFHQAEPLLGNLIATIATNGGEPQPFNGSLPDKPGTYKIVYKVENTSNYSELYWEKTFKIYPSELIEGGYKVTGLGEKGDEIAVVFTENANWTVPVNIKNARFLVVGAGGGGGADVATDDERMAGAGGGGGGVVTGRINLTKSQDVTITVGTGGTGGIRGDDGLLAKWGAAQTAATDSLFSFDDSHYVKAFAGGADMGSTAQSATSGGQQGGAGGSSAGSRPTKTTVGGDANKGDVASGTVISSTKYGNKGGKGASQYQAGGGGGATAVGGNGVAESGGVGGEGLASDITGALLVYGSGGGGGGITADAANGGTGAGNGGRYNYATSGMPNQGGGGGGAGRVGNGGNGGSGVVVFRYSVYEAEVVTAEGSTLYATFAEAFDAAQAGETVKLINDATTAGFKIQKSVTLDLNGNTLTLTPPAVGSAGTETLGIQILAAAENVTIKNGTINVAESNLNAEKPIKMMINNYTNLALVNATLDGTNLVKPSNMAAYTLSNNSGTVTIDADSAIIAKEGGIAFDVCKYSTYAPPVVTVEEGATITGTVELSGGTLDAPEGITVGSGVADWVAKYVDGAWTLVESVKDPFVVAETRYATFAEALAAVEDGGTITVHENAEKSVYETPGFVLNKSVTIELNGRTLTLTPPAVGSSGTETLGIQILPVSGREDAMNVTIKNGTINIAESNLTAEKPIKMMINNYVTGALTLENVSLDGTNLVKPASSPIYVLSNNRGNVALNGETSIVAPEGAVAFDVCQFKSYTPPTVTLNTTGTISGKVEVSGGDLVIGAENTATLSAIDFTAGSVKGDVESILAIPEDKKLVETEGVYTLTDKDVLAKVGDKLFETIGDAFAAAQAGDTVILMKDFAVETVLAIPEGVTLDLNGKTFTGDALGVVSIDSGTYAKLQDVYGISDDAVLTLATGGITLNSGSLEVVPDELVIENLQLTVGSGTELVIPEGKKISVMTSLVVNGTLSGAGEVILGATLARFTGAEGLAVASAVEGYKVVYANGVYSLEEIPAEYVAQVGDVKYATLQAALDDDANLAATITLIANTKEEVVSIPAGFTGTIDLGGFTLNGRIVATGTADSKITAVIQNGSIYNEHSSKDAVIVEANSTVTLKNLNVTGTKRHIIRVNASGNCIVDSGTYTLIRNGAGCNILYLAETGAKMTVNGGTFIAEGGTYIEGQYIHAINTSGANSKIIVYGGDFTNAYINQFINNGSAEKIDVYGGVFPIDPKDYTVLYGFKEGYVEAGYTVEGTGPYTVVKAWTAPLPTDPNDSTTPIEAEYDDAVVEALEDVSAKSITVTVNGDRKYGDAAVEALNTAFACFVNKDGSALAFAGEDATLDIVIKVTEVNTEDPAASTVVVERGTEELTVKVAPTVKYIDLATGDEIEKPETGAVIFKIVFEAPVAE